MRHCDSCDITVTGDSERCPLCRNLLSGSPDPGSRVFPALPPPRYKRHLLYKLTSAAAIAASVICIAVNRMIPHSGNWALLACAGIAGLWFAAMVGIAQRRNLIRNITWQLFILSGICVLLDQISGRYGWSVDYVLPCLCVGSMASMIVLAAVLRLPSNEYLFNLTLTGIFSLLPALLIFFGAVVTDWPSVICTACAVILLAFIWIFGGRKAGRELVKKFHLK